MFTAPFADLLIRCLIGLFILQSMGFLWFIYVVFRFGLLRKPGQEAISQMPARKPGNIVSFEEARRALER